jgi:hypothetical protein
METPPVRARSNGGRWCWTPRQAVSRRLRCALDGRQRRTGGVAGVACGAPVALIADAILSTQTHDCRRLRRLRDLAGRGDIRRPTGGPPRTRVRRSRLRSPARLPRLREGIAFGRAGCSATHSGEWTMADPSGGEGRVSRSGRVSRRRRGRACALRRSRQSGWRESVEGGRSFGTEHRSAELRLITTSGTGASDLPPHNQW